MFWPTSSIGIGDREFRTFTLHDRTHAIKVAHLMWHILEQDRRDRLTPPEIGVLVAAAYLHDVGMAVSADERARLLASSSDLWTRVDEETRERMAEMEAALSGGDLSESDQTRLRQELDQAYEALLAEYLRLLHASRDRYETVLGELEQLAADDPTRVPSVEASLVYDGDSYLDAVVTVCISHNENADSLVKADPTNLARRRYPEALPVGDATVDLQMAAAALRLADVLDFDRERTPSVLFYYLIPSADRLAVDLSTLEWSKHLAISHWSIESGEIVYRGRSASFIAHHAVVSFCEYIAQEIALTKATFEAFGRPWPFVLPTACRADIHEEGYHYLPYRFELEDDRVYELLMGGALYDNRLAAVRELIQNAVDACQLRDKTMQVSDTSFVPVAEDRIVLKYMAGTESATPELVIEDSGTGMDAFIIEHFLLRVGKSYYDSVEFRETRTRLAQGGVDFAPVSEFGIGFLSVFMLADRITVETALWEPIRGDTRLRVLEIHGPTRLIQVAEQPNDGLERFKGTRVVLQLRVHGERPPSWDEIVSYVRRTCVRLPYAVRLEHHDDGGVVEERVEPAELTVALGEEVEASALRIPVAEDKWGLSGEIVLVNPTQMRAIEARLAAEEPVAIREELERTATVFSRSRYEHDGSRSALLRGGFRIGAVPGLSSSYLISGEAGIAILELPWKSEARKRYAITDVGRQRVRDETAIADRVVQIWLGCLLENVDELPPDQVGRLTLRGIGSRLSRAQWLEAHDAWTVYKLARNGWAAALRRDQGPEDPLAEWEAGRGGALFVGDERGELYRELLGLVLPRVTTLQMAYTARYFVGPPATGWQDELRGWTTFISDPVRFGRFAEYVGEIEELLYFEYPGAEHLNSRLAGRLPPLSDEEAKQLIAGLRSLVTAKRRQRQASVTSSEAAVLGAVRDGADDVRAGSIDGDWSIGELLP